MIIYNKLNNYFFVSANRQTFLGFEMMANLRDTSPLSTYKANWLREIFQRIKACLQKCAANGE